MKVLHDARYTAVLSNLEYFIPANSPKMYFKKDQEKITAK
jgi:hypothetical protein